MMKRFRSRGVLVTAVVVCVQWQCYGDNTVMDRGGADLGRLYGCAANSLWLYSHAEGHAVTYERALKRLPPTRDGNTVLELVHAMEGLGWKMEVSRCSPMGLAGLGSPAVVFIPPRSEASGALGHFFTLRPLAEGVVQVLDFPVRRPAILSEEQLALELQARGIDEVVVLSRKGSRGETRGRAHGLVAKEVGEHGLLSTVRIGPKNRALIAWGRADWGVRREGDEVECVFRLINETNDELQIARIAKGCACSEAKCDSLRIPAGGETKVRVVSSLAGKTTRMSIDAVVHFAETTGMQPVMLRMTGLIGSRWTWGDRTVDLGVHRRSDGLSTVRIPIREAPGAGKVVQLAKAVTSASFLRVDLLNEAVEARGDADYMLAITLATEKAPRVFREVVEVFASGSDVASARYDVVGEVLREVTAEPAWLFVRVDCGGRGSGVITIHHGERIPLQLDSVTLGAPECGMRLVGHTVSCHAFQV